MSGADRSAPQAASKVIQPGVAPRAVPGAVVVAGPTASGKSRLALSIAEALGGTIVNADSMQVYRDLCILTARPSLGDESRASHELYGYVDAAERYSAGRWRADAIAAIEASAARGRLPILVGGTGLYLRALSDGLAKIPDISAALRDEATRLHRRLGGDRFRAILVERDPASARLLPGDAQRLIRAWEVLEATGRPIGAWQAAPTGAGIPVLTILLTPPRKEVYAAIDARFRSMVENGGLEEAAALRARNLGADLPAMKAVGAPELFQVLDGRIGLDAAVATASRNSRRYAKRQFTWFRHQLRADLTIDAKLSEIPDEEIVHFIQGKGLTGNF